MNSRAVTVTTKPAGSGLEWITVGSGGSAWSGTGLYHSWVGSKGGIMPFWRLYYHLVWATKCREHFISPDIAERLYSYLVNKAAELGVYVYAINGWPDHVHLVVSIPPKYAVAYVVKRLKGASAHDLNHAGGIDFYFAWQRGYGALSLGERQKPIAVAYVENQKQHHAQQTTNAWLERYTEFDEGPDDVGLAVGAVPAILSERAGDYNVLGALPF